MKTKESILITGICGEIGSNFAKWLCENTEYEVIGLDNLSDGYLENVDLNKIKFYLRDAQADLTDIFEKHNIKYCYAMAAFCAEGFSPFVRKFSYQNNIIITANLINHCVKYKCKLIYLSSMSIYGRNEVPFYETQTPNPIDSYGIAKFAGEMDIRVAGEQHGLNWAIIRPHNVIGRNCNIWSRYRNVLGRWMNQIKNNQPLTIYGDGEQKRAFSWVLDYCEPFLKVAENNYPEPIFNVGGDAFFTLNQVADLLFEVTGKNTGKVYLQERFEVKNAYSNHDKAKQILGFEPKTDLKSMLEQMWEWVKVQPNREIKTFENIELAEGLYEFWK